VGKAQEIYVCCLAFSDYEIVKAPVLNAYKLVPGAYWQKFRERRISGNQTYIEAKTDYLTDGAHPWVLTKTSRKLGS